MASPGSAQPVVPPLRPTVAANDGIHFCQLIWLALTQSSVEKRCFFSSSSCSCLLFLSLSLSLTHSLSQSVSFFLFFALQEHADLFFRFVMPCFYHLFLPFLLFHSELGTEPCDLFSLIFLTASVIVMFSAVIM